MTFKKVVAIVRTACLEDIEAALKAVDITGMSISTVSGHGEYLSSDTKTWRTEQVKIEVFTESPKVKKIIETIMSVAKTGLAGDGIVCVLPVDMIVRVRDNSIFSSSLMEKR